MKYLYMGNIPEVKEITAIGLDGVRFGKSTSGDICQPSGTELLYNAFFDCGDKGWGFDPAYPATITDNGDGTVHLKTDSNFGSLVPAKDAFPADTYHIECSVINVVGDGKISIRRPNGTWVSNATYSTDGIYSFNYSGTIAEIHVGANGDNTFEADYEYISLTKAVPYEGLTTDTDDQLTTDTDEDLTV